MSKRWNVQLSDAGIRGIVGAAAFLRGAAYARDGRVEGLQVGADVIFASVIGTSARPYQVLVVERSDDPDDIEASCTCPVRVNCKHAAAAMIAARDRAGTAGRPTWKRALDSLVDENSGEPEARAKPLALLFDVTDGSPARRGPTRGRRRVTIQPATMGKRGAWIRTGVSWQDMQHPHLRSAFLPEHRDALRELYMGSGAAQRGGAGDAAIDLNDYTSSLWRRLAAARDAGVELVAGKSTGRRIRLSPREADVSFDLRRESARGAAQLSPTVRMDGETLPFESLLLIGSPPHGALVEGDDAFELVAFETPMTERSASLLTGEIAIPAGDVDEFLADYYPVLSRVVTITSSDASVTLPELPTPRLVLTATFGEEHVLRLAWEYAYDVGGHERRYPVDAAVADGTRDVRLERDLLVRASRIVARWPQLYGRSGTIAATAQLAAMDAVGFAEDALPVLRDDADIDVRVVGIEPAFAEADDAPLVRVQANDTDDHTDWFELEVSVTVGGEDVPFDSLFTALARSETHLILDSGTYFRIDRPELRDLRRLIEEARTLADRDSDELRISAYQAGLWSELAELGVVERQSERWASSVKGLLDLDSIDTPEVPARIDAQLRPYQLDGFHWLSFLWDHQLGGVLADDMGLGKTLQTLAMIARAHDSGRTTSPFLVIAPTSVVQNWAREAERFAPGLTVQTVTGTAPKRGVPLADAIADAQIVVTSYALFRLEYDAYDRLPWEGLVIDEAQFVKNYQAKTYQCVRRLSAPFKLAITGTPLENSLMDLWAMLSIVAPGMFPRPERFKEFYRNPIERRRDSEKLTTLRRRVGPLMRRRTKEQVAAELPPKQEQVLEVALSPRHRKIYDTHLQRERKKILGLLDDLDENRFTILQSLTLLRQLSLDPYLVDDAHSAVTSSKVDALAEQLTESVAEGHRALVFSQFTRFLGRVRERLDAAGIAYCYLDGGTRDRGAVLEEFRTGGAPVFLISLKAGGFGLNLTEADYCFILDPWWNPAVEQQAVDRTHRIGQDKTVIVYRMVATDTIEQKVMELKARKQDLFARVMDEGGSQLSAPLSTDDIRGLLGVE